MGRLIDLTGRQIGSWSVISRGPSSVGRRTRWECRCVCGAVRLVVAIHLMRGTSASCGCQRPSGEQHQKFRHGGKKHGSIYGVYCNMISRCENQTNPQYPDYGGRGIKICRRWREDFGMFLADMGPRPSGLTLDRINNDGNYEPANCRWADRKTQARNNRHCHLVTVHGETMPLIVAVERYGGIYGTVKWRLQQGQSIEKALRL